MRLHFILLVAVVLAGCQGRELAISEQTAIQCLLLTGPVGKEFIFQSEQDFQELQKYKHDAGRCANRTLPEIDFNKFTLLGKITETEACAVKFSRKVYWFEEDKRVDYHIGIRPRGSCTMKTIATNWMLVEKIPEDFSINFVVR